MSSLRSFVIVGRITRPHGIRGEVCAQYYAESFSYFEEGQIFLKTEKSEAKTVAITSWRAQGNLLILKIKGVNTRTEAEFLRNYDLVIDETLLAYESEQGELDGDFQEDGLISLDDVSLDDLEASEQAPFLYHIIGSKAILHSGAKNGAEDSQNDASVTVDYEEELGIIEEISFPAGQELWTIKSRDGKEILFPAVSEFIEKYDLPNKKVYINPPEGLVDLYLAEQSEKEPKSSSHKPSARKQTSKQKNK